MSAFADNVLMGLVIGQTWTYYSSVQPARRCRDRKGERKDRGELRHPSDLASRPLWPSF